MAKRVNPVARRGLMTDQLSREAPPANRRGKRWMIRVTFPSGADAFLRRGSRPGYGPIVQFRTKRDADINLDFVTQGFDRGTVAVVVPYDKSEE